MKCPLLAVGYLATRDPGVDSRSDCLKEECAWWVETQAECAIKQLSLSLGFISLDTTQLLEKMPHEEQFRK